MEQQDAFALGRSNLNGFLFADIGVERSGMPLSVISALARQGLDPWYEAGRLAKLPRTTATDGLARLIATVPASLWPLPDATAIAVRLIALLPGQSDRPVGAQSSLSSNSTCLGRRKQYLEDSMANDFLGDRRIGLEEAFFAEQDAILRRRLGEAEEANTRRETLAAASGIKNNAVLDKLLAQNVTSATVAALSLVPLVVVAWADGSLDDRERTAILAGAAQAGLDRQHPSYQLFEGWLARKPPAALVATWREYVSALSATLTDDARHAFKSELLGRARRVAEAAGGFMGMGSKVSAAEMAVLGELELAFAA